MIINLIIIKKQARLFSVLNVNLKIILYKFLYKVHLQGILEKNIIKIINN